MFHYNYFYGVFFQIIILIARLLGKHSHRTWTGLRNASHKLSHCLQIRCDLILVVGLPCEHSVHKAFSVVNQTRACRWSRAGKVVCLFVFAFRLCSPGTAYIHEFLILWIANNRQFLSTKLS